MAKEDDDDVFGVEDDDDSTVDPGGVEASTSPPGFVALDDDPDDDTEQARSRRDKKRERGQLFSALKESQALNRELMQRITTPQQQHVQQEDPYDVEIRKTLAEDRRLHKHGANLIAEAARAGKPLSDEQLQVMQDAVTINELRRNELIAERAARRVGSEMNNPQRAAQEVLQAQYKDVRENPQAIKWAQARYALLVAEGREDSPQLTKAVMNEARTKFKLATGRTHGPSDGDRRRWINVPGGGGGGSADTSDRRGRVMSNAERKMAETMYDKLPPEKAHKEWLKTVGSNLKGASKN